MKKNSIPAIAVFLLIGFLSLTACKKDCENPCVNGNCVDQVCECDSGWTGATCETNTDPCYDVNCVNGNCVDGTCECDSAYEGTLCDQRKTKKYAGTYNASDSCGTGPITYVTSITEHSTELFRIMITNLNDFDGQGITQDVIADLDSTGLAFTLPSQNLLGTTVTGSGSLDPSTGVITITYNKVGVSNDNCVAVLTPQ